jgi:ribonuclease HI
MDYFNHDFGLKIDENTITYGDRQFVIKSPLKKRLAVIKELWSILLELKLVDSINWLYVFTDGSATKNGRVDAVARGGFYIELSINSLGKEVINPFKNYYNIQYVKGYEYVLNGKIEVNEVEVQPSNNRGELLGICLAFYHLRSLSKLIKLNKVLIITDSMYSINTISSFYPKRLKNGTEKELANSDLLAIAHSLNNYEFEHIRSHKDQPCVCLCDKYRKWKGNSIIDSLVEV